MNRKIFSIIVISGLVYLGVWGTSSYALSLNELEGLEFMVFFSCDNEVGGYCGKNEIETEEFMFEEENAFWVKTFKDESYFNLDFASGTYKDSGIIFEADFEAIEELTKKYVFDIVSLNIFDGLILGQSEVVYYKYGIPEFDYVKEDEAKCYFIGFPK